MASEAAKKAAAEVVERIDGLELTESDTPESMMAMARELIADALDTFRLTQSVRSDTRPPRNVAPLVERNGRLCAPVGCVVDEEGVVRRDWFNDFSARAHEWQLATFPKATAMKRAATEAATHAMKAERERIKRAVTTRILNLTPGTSGYRVLEDVLQDIEGPMSGAPKKGAKR